MNVDNETNSWGDFLATPPNMFGTPPGVLPSDFVSTPNPPFSQLIPESDIRQVLTPQQPAQKAVPQQPAPKQNYQPAQQQQQQQYSQHGGLENRTLIIFNANPSTTLDEIMKMFGAKWAVSKVDMDKIKEGSFTVEFYDIRDSNSAKMLLNHSVLHRNNITINFAPLPVISDPKKPPNNGTIVIFHLPPGILDDQIMSIFGQYGEIRQIRGTPSKIQQKFVEYYDTRAAELALMSMNGNYVMGTRVSIEFSLPGGFRRGIQKVETYSNQAQKPNSK